MIGDFCLPFPLALMKPAAMSYGEVHTDKDLSSSLPDREELSL
jgi:hypothetical protein